MHFEPLFPKYCTLGTSVLFFSFFFFQPLSAAANLSGSPAGQCNQNPCMKTLWHLQCKYDKWPKEKKEIRKENKRKSNPSMHTKYSKTSHLVKGTSDKSLSNYKSLMQEKPPFCSVHSKGKWRKMWNEASTYFWSTIKFSPWLTNI